jgi:hypothetical protein
MELPTGLEGAFMGVDTGGGPCSSRARGHRLLVVIGLGDDVRAHAVHRPRARNRHPEVSPEAAAASAEEAAKKAAADAAEAKAVQDEGRRCSAT